MNDEELEEEQPLTVDELLEESITIGFQLRELVKDLSENYRDIESSLQKRPTRTASVMMSPVEELCWDGRRLNVRKKGSFALVPLIGCSQGIRIAASEFVPELLNKVRS